MSTTVLLPPYAANAEAALAELTARGYTVMSPAAFEADMGCPAGELAEWGAGWQNLPPDAHLRDGGRYRRRRHSCFVVQAGQCRQVPHRAHWQPVAYNALHGGIERWFEPMEDALLQRAGWAQLLCGLARYASALKGERAWYVEAHQFRIDTSDGIGRPTPEGAHRDGVDLVAVLLMGRHGVKGGETRVFEAQGADGRRFTMSAPGSCLLLDDERVIHETTPIQPLEGVDLGWRDTLVLTYRAGGFQSA